MVNRKFLTFIIILLFVITGSATKLTSTDQVKSSIKEWLTTHYPVSNGRWEVWLLEATVDMKELTDEIIKVICVKDTTKPKKIMNFKLCQQQQKFDVRARVVCYKSVLVTRNIMQRRKTLTSEDWQIEERSSGVVPHDAVRRSSEIDNCRTKKVMVRGEIITRHAIEKKPVVMQGKRLTLQVQGNGISIKTDVYTLEEGHIGDWIKVKQCNSGKICTGKIVHPELTQIVLNRRNWKCPAE